MIYFIQDGTDGPIKIGYSDDVTERVKSLSTSTHNKLRILLVISGEREQEDQLHDRFRMMRGKACILSVGRFWVKRRAVISTKGSGKF